MCCYGDASRRETHSRSVGGLITRLHVHSLQNSAHFHDPSIYSCLFHSGEDLFIRFYPWTEWDGRVQKLLFLLITSGHFQSVSFCVLHWKCSTIVGEYFTFLLKWERCNNSAPVTPEEGQFWNIISAVRQDPYICFPNLFFSKTVVIRICRYLYLILNEWTTVITTDSRHFDLM